jgi:pimeloyl-ACP methyl ester carboxylesterase
MNPLSFRSLILSLTVIACSLAARASLVAQSVAVTHADSAPAIRFITVQPNVQLEVLDWGGTGQPMVLLAGLGNTAHVFNNLARQLRANHHVFGITRRGFGRSSVPSSGFSADRLGDDVLAVMDSLRLTRPMLVGHSIAGEELSSIGSRHGDRVSALVYLDAADGYAFYDTTSGDLRVDLAELRRKLDTFRSAPSPGVIDILLNTALPAFERDLREVKAALAEGPPPPPPPSGVTMDRSSFITFRDSRAQMFGFAEPIAELREQFEELPGGGVGRALRSPQDARTVSEAITGGLQKYLRVSAPVLAIFARPKPPDNFPTAAARAAFIARDSTIRAKLSAAVRRGAPYAHVVEVPGATHYVFLSNEADVVREINAFLNSLSHKAGP